MERNSNGFALLLKRIVNKIGRPLGVNPFPRAFPNPLAASASRRSEVFDAVYLENFWGSEQSRSGLGSERDFAERYRSALEALMRQRGFRSIFDAPCGDLNWMGDLITSNSWSYAGGDISRHVVEEVQRKHPELSVRVFDVCEDPFPEADVWHCRDCLFHLPFADVRKAFENFARSNIPHALLTTHKARLLHKNLDVEAGGFRFLDLERPPISLPAAADYLQDYRKGTDFPRYVGLWTRENIRQALSRWPS